MLFQGKAAGFRGVFSVFTRSNYGKQGVFAY